MGQRQGVLSAPKVVTATTSLDEWHLAQYDVIRCDTSAIRLDLPTISISDLDCTIWNASSGEIYLSGAANSQTFIDGDATVVVPPYQAVRLGTCVGSTTSGVPALNYFTDQKTNDIVGSWTVTDSDTWGTADPASITASGMYVVHDGVMFFSLRMASADGNAADSLIIEHVPDYPPQKISQEIPIAAQQLVDTTYSDMYGYVDAAQAAAADQQIEFHNYSTCTDGKACEVLVQGWYFLWGATAYTPTATFGTGTPGSATNTGYYKIIDDCVGLVNTHYTSADSNGASSCTLSTPFACADVDTIIAVQANQLAGAAGTTHSNPCGYIDASSATAETRGLIQFYDWTTATDGKTVAVQTSAIIPLNKERWTNVTSTQISQSFTTGTPANITKKFLVFSSGNVAFYAYYWTSTDGNGATALVTESIAPPRYLANHKQAAVSYQLQNTTDSCPLGYWESNTADPADCELVQSAMSTATDAQTVTEAFSGFIII